MRFVFLFACITAVAAAQNLPTIASVVNSASQDTRLAPGAMADVVGSNLGTDPSAGATVGGRNAKVVKATNSKWTIVIPSTLAAGPSTVEIGLSVPFNITLVDYAPALFSADGTGRGLVSAWGYRLTPTGGLIQPGYQLADTTPAKLGDVLVLDATGLGPFDSNNYNETVDTPAVTIGGKPMLVISAWFTDNLFGCVGPCTLGEYQVMVSLPDALAVGSQPITMSIGGDSTQTHQTLSVPINNLPIVKGIVNAASFDAKAAIVPGSLASVFGTTFGVTDQLNGFPATDFSGVSVSFNGIKAPILALVASRGQINLQVPTNLPEAGPATVSVTTPDGVSADFTIQMGNAAPGVFQLQDHNAAAQFANTAWIPMPASIAQFYGIPTNCHATAGLSVATLCGEPAQRGDYIQIYATALGPAAPDGDPSKGTLGTGQLAPGNPLYKTVYQPTVTVGGVPAIVSFSGLTPGFAGLYQINIQIPATAPIADYVPVSVMMPNGTKDEATTIAIRQ